METVWQLMRQNENDPAIAVGGGEMKRRGLFAPWGKADKSNRMTEYKLDKAPHPYLSRKNGSACKFARPCHSGEWAGSCIYGNLDSVSSIG